MLSPMLHSVHSSPWRSAKVEERAHPALQPCPILPNLAIATSYNASAANAACASLFATAQHPFLPVCDGAPFFAQRFDP